MNLLRYWLAIFILISSGCSTEYALPPESVEKQEPSKMPIPPVVVPEPTEKSLPITQPLKTTVLPDADLSSALKKAALAPGDVIPIDVVGEEELSKDFVVPTDGIILSPDQDCEFIGQNSQRSD